MGEEAAQKAAALKPGQVLLLENLRFYAEEEGKPRGLADDATDEEKAAAKKAVKASQKEFVKRLASYADCYINDAFGTAHRAHASTALIAEYFPNDKMFGYVMEGELKAIDKVLDNPARPFTAILGGSKVSTKISVIENLMKRVDNLILGGGMTYTFKAAHGRQGRHEHLRTRPVRHGTRHPEKGQGAEREYLSGRGRRMRQRIQERHRHADLPGRTTFPTAGKVSTSDPKPDEAFAKVIAESKTILWNGPGRRIRNG